MPSTNRGAAASQASEHPAHAPRTAPKASDIFKARPATPNGGTDAPPPAAGLPQPHAPSAAAPGLHAPRPEPSNDCPPPGIPPGEVRPAADLQVSKKPGAEARPASLLLDERSDSGHAAPLWPEEDLPHDLGHDCSPSPSDAWPDMSDSDTAAQPLGETRCAVCGEVLPDAAAVDRHIRLHRPSPPPEPVYPFACPVCRARYKTERGLNAHVSRFRHFLPLDDTVHEYIGIPNGTPTPELLHLLATTFVRVSKQLPPTEALARFLSTCRRMEGSGRLPPSRLLLRRGLLGRAWQAVQSEASQAAAVPEPTGEERLAVIRELHPAPMDVSLPEVPHTRGPAPKVTGAALLKELRSMKAVATGPSGLGKPHLLHLCERADAAEVLAAALAPLLSDCDWGRLKPLAEFRLKLLAKPNGRWRPIAIQETLLVALHRALLRQTPALRRLPPWQLAFEPMAQVKAIARAEALKREHHLLTVDVRNAFNSVPHGVILFALRRARVPAATVSYIASFLTARHAADLSSVPAGVPQGDPLSMALFCLSLVWPVESFLSAYKVLAYADDMILAFPPSVPASRARDDARDALARVGLSVVPEKCASTQEGGVSFMGTRILRDAPFNLAETAARALHAHLGVLRAAGLSRHDRLRLLAACVVPSVNYGPLVDAYPGPRSYREVDDMVVAEVGALLEIPEQLARALALAPRAAHGLALVLPHCFHADMQKQRQAMRAGTFRDLRKGQLKDAAPLRSFLPLALLRGPALSDDQVVFVGECLAGRYQKTRPMGSCRYCQQPMLPRHHLVCKGINGLHVARHEKIMAALLAAARGKTARIARNPAVPVDRLQPDFVIGDGFGDLVVAVPWRLERSYALKMGKYLPLLQSGRAAHFLPIVVGGDGTLHPASAAGLAKLGVDLLRFKQEAAQVILWHYAQTALAFASLPVDAPPGQAAAQVAAPAGHGAPRTGGSPLVPGPPSPSPSPSVEIVAEERPHPSRRAEEEAAGRGTHVKCLHPRAWRVPAPVPPAPPLPGEPSEPFVCSRAPSPPPLEDEGHAAQQLGTSEAEPLPKTLPPIFRRVDAGQRPPAGDPFCPFKRIPAKA